MGEPVTIRVELPVPSSGIPVYVPTSHEGLGPGLCHPALGGDCLDIAGSIELYGPVESVNGVRKVMAKSHYDYEIIVVDDGYDLFLSLVLYPSFAWDEAAYHLEGDPEGRSFAELLVDVIVAEVIEPWGGGKWHLEIFRSISPEPEDWNGEM